MLSSLCLKGYLRSVVRPKKMIPLANIYLQTKRLKNLQNRRKFENRIQDYLSKMPSPWIIFFATRGILSIIAKIHWFLSSIFCLCLLRIIEWQHCCMKWKFLLRNSIKRISRGSWFRSELERLLFLLHQWASYSFSLNFALKKNSFFSRVLSSIYFRCWIVLVIYRTSIA